MSLYQLQVFADYHQFYLWDAGVGPSAPGDYTAADIRRLVKVSPNVVVVQPVRNMTVPVDVEVHASDPGFDEGPWDHIVECSLDLPTGRLQIHECTGPDRLSLSIAPGTYNIRVLFAGLDTLSDNGVDGFDRYRIDLWPAPARELRVVKQWDEGSG